MRLIQSADDFLTDAAATSDTDEDDGFDTDDVCCDQAGGRDNQVIQLVPNGWKYLYFKIIKWQRIMTDTFPNIKNLQSIW